MTDGKHPLPEVKHEVICGVSGIRELYSVFSYAESYTSYNITLRKQIWWKFFTMVATMLIKKIGHTNGNNMGKETPEVREKGH